MSIFILKDFKRIQTKHLFLTWPHCNISREEVLKNASQEFEPNKIISYLIACESHKDGSAHIHAYIHLQDTINITVRKNLDAITGKHGNYQSCRSPKNVMQYCIKEDQNWLANFDVEAKLASMISKKKFIGHEIIRNGRLPHQLVEDNPEFLLDLPNMHRSLELFNFLSQKPRNHPMEVIIYWGTAGTGKSKSAHEQWPNAYWVPKGKWWPGYANQETIIVDEFYGWWEYDFVLRLCDRYPLTIETKGGHAQFNSKRIVFTSNSQWETWWTKTHDLAPFRRRITEVKYFSG